MNALNPQTHQLKLPLWMSHQVLLHQAWLSGFTIRLLIQNRITNCQNTPPLFCLWPGLFREKLEFAQLHSAYRAPYLVIFLTQAPSDITSPPYQPAPWSLLQIIVTSEGWQFKYYSHYGSDHCCIDLDSHLTFWTLIADINGHFCGSSSKEYYIYADNTEIKKVDQTVTYLIEIEFICVLQQHCTQFFFGAYAEWITSTRQKLCQSSELSVKFKGKYKCLPSP